MTPDLNTVIRQLDKYITDEKYCGNEPYDGLNTRFGLLKKTKAVRLLTTHLNKMSPINARPLLAIQKYQHTKTLALLLTAYCNLYELTRKSEYEEKYIECRDFLLQKELPGGGLGGSYDYQMRNWLASRNGLSTLGTMLAIKGLIRGHVCFGFDSDLTKAKEFTHVIVEKHVVPRDNGIHIIYASGQPRSILNVYSMTAGALSLVYSITKDKKLYDLATNILRELISHQFNNGAWPYMAGSPYERTQIDFHQGFVLEGLCDYQSATNGVNTLFATAMDKGFDFYRQYLFTKDGCSRFRLSRKYPVDIHNQAEGILAFSQYAMFSRNALWIAERIAEWTNRNMYDENKGIYYYQKWPLFTNRIAYMAWGQANMLLALSTFALQKKDIISKRQPEYIHSR
ncbi:MAG: hypothetical protein JXA82_14205 [Sedimentisphaerales bacterium]|nr:hypothetical protein [Sedimentisphaerales bacterium]